MAATASASAPPRVALALVVAAYLLPLVVPVPLMEDDEGLHAAIAIEMVERGDWTVPRLLGQPFLDKPILYFWMQAASLSTLGASEFAVRLPGTLTALAGAAATGWLARVLFGAWIGTWAAVIYATMLLPYAVSLAPLHDLVMVPLVASALGAFWQVHRASSTTAVAGWTAAAGVALGLSILGKGLTGVGLIGVGMVAWMAWTGTWSTRLIVAGATAVAIAVAIAWPWYAAMEAASPGYLQYFILDRHIGGVASDTQRHAGRPFWYYLPIVAIGTWPWGPAAMRSRFRDAAPAERLVWAWLIADVVLLSAAGSKLATYLLPVFPAVALLAARAITSTRAVAGAGPGWVMMPTAILPLVGLTYVVYAGTPVAPNPWAWTIVVPVIVVGVLLVSARGQGWTAWQRVLVVTSVALATAALAVRPVVADQLTARSLAARINASGALPRTLFIVDEGVGSFLFYLRPELRRGLTPDRVQRISRFSLGDVLGSPDALVAVAVDRLDGVRELYDLPPGPAVEAGAFQVVPVAEIRARIR